MALSHARLSDLRHRLRLPTFKNVAGALQGYHRSIFTGHGMDFDDMVPYLPGDDVTDIDWKASARAGEPIIRRFVKETNLAVLLACDTSIAMTALAPSGQPKSEVAADLIDVIAYLARVRSDYLGVVYQSADGLAQVPARSGSEHFERARRALRGALADPAPDPVLPGVLARADSLIRRRTLVVIVGDEGKLESLLPSGVLRFGRREDWGRREVWGQPSGTARGVSVRQVRDTNIRYLGQHFGASYIEHQKFARAVREGLPAEIPLDEGLRAVAVGLAAHRSIETGAPVALRDVLPAELC